MATYGPSILRGFLVTVEVAILIVFLGLFVGLALAIVRCLHVRFLDVLIVAYIDVFRTLPQLVVIIFVFAAVISRISGCT